MTPNYRWRNFSPFTTAQASDPNSDTVKMIQPHPLVQSILNNIYDPNQMNQNRNISKGIADSANLTPDNPMLQNPVTPQAAVTSLPRVAPPQIAAPHVAAPETSDIEDRINALAMNAPRREDYIPSTARRIFAMIGGGLAGAAGHPEAGGQFLNRPFDQAMGDWQNKLKALDPVGKLNLTSRQLDFNTDKTNAANQLGADKANQISADKTAKLTETNRHDLETEARLKALAEKDPAFVVKLKNWQAARDQHNAGIMSDRDYDIVTQIAGGGTTGSFAEKQEIRKKTAADIAEETAKGRNTANTSQVNITGQTALSQGKAEGSARGAANVKYDPEIIKKEVERETAISAAKEQAKQSAIDKMVEPVVAQINSAPVENRFKLLNMLPAAHKLAAFKKLDLSEIPTDPKDSEYIKNGKVTLNHIDTLRGMLHDPYIRDNIGAISGRINLAGQSVGGDLVAGNEEDAKKEQKFLTSAMQLLAWEVKNVAGGRPPALWLKTFQSTAPGATKGLGQNLGALEGVEQSTWNNINGRLGKVNTGNKDINNSKQVPGEKKKGGDPFDRMEVVK